MRTLEKYWQFCPTVYLTLTSQFHSFIYIISAEKLWGRCLWYFRYMPYKQLPYVRLFTIFTDVRKANSRKEYFVDEAAIKDYDINRSVRGNRWKSCTSPSPWGIYRRVIFQLFTLPKPKPQLRNKPLDNIWEGRWMECQVEISGHDKSSDYMITDCERRSLSNLQQRKS